MTHRHLLLLLQLKEEGILLLLPLLLQVEGEEVSVVNVVLRREQAQRSASLVATDCEHPKKICTKLVLFVLSLFYLFQNKKKKELCFYFTIVLRNVFLPPTKLRMCVSTSGGTRCKWLTVSMLCC